MLVKAENGKLRFTVDTPIFQLNAPKDTVQKIGTTRYPPVPMVTGQAI
jgi:hypothetical protein